MEFKQQQPMINFFLYYIFNHLNLKKKNKNGEQILREKNSNIKNNCKVD